MQFKLTKELIEGRYYVKAKLTEFTELEKSKAKKFGIPTLTLKSSSGVDFRPKITTLAQYEVYGFYKQDEADQYAENIKQQISDLKTKWENLEDTWSNEEAL